MQIVYRKYLKSAAVSAVTLLWSILFFAMFQGTAFLSSAIPCSAPERETGSSGKSVFFRSQERFLFLAERSPESQSLSQLLRQRTFRSICCRRNPQSLSHGGRSAGEQYRSQQIVSCFTAFSRYEATLRTVCRLCLNQLESNTPVRAGPFEAFYS